MILPKLIPGNKPAYERLYLSFRDAILAAQIPSGARLPSSREIAAHYGVSRNTALQAYEQLSCEGFTEGRHGSGTFVAAILPDTHLNSPTKAPMKRVKKPRHQFFTPTPFVSGIPDFEKFPREIWLKLYARHLRSTPYSLAHYGHECGYAPLRDAIAGYLATRRGVRCSSEQVIILPGSQAGIDLCIRALAKPGDSVWIEDPCYTGIKLATKRHGVSAIPLPIDEQGLNVSDGLRLAPDASLAIVTPSHQFPLGYAMSASRRLELIRWAADSGSWILEDDYDSEFRFRGQPLPALHSLDPNGRTLYLGTFSKALFPDLRIGYLVAPETVVERFQAEFRVSVGGPPVGMQAALADFINEGHFARHMRRMRLLYAKRMAAMLAAIETHCADLLEPGPSDSGMHLAVYLKNGGDDVAIARRAEEAGIVVRPLSPLSAGGRPGFYLGISCFGEREIDKGMAKLAKAVR